MRCVFGQTLTVACVLVCLGSERKQKLVDVKKKLEKLQQSATLVQQRTQYERATVWAAVKCQQNQLTIFNQQLEVSVCCYGDTPLAGRGHVSVLALALSMLVHCHVVHQPPEACVGAVRMCA